MEPIGNEQEIIEDSIRKLVDVSTHETSSIVENEVIDALATRIETLVREMGPIAPERASALGMLALRSTQAKLIREEQGSLVRDARRFGATWADIGRSAGISSQSAHRKWDAQAKKKHREYQQGKKSHIESESIE